MLEQLLGPYLNVVAACPSVYVHLQALFLGHLLASGELTDTELDVIASSRKSRGGTVRKRFSTQEEVEVYNKATALEVLVGFLALRDKERLKRVFQCWEEWICQQG